MWSYFASFRLFSLKKKVALANGAEEEDYAFSSTFQCISVYVYNVVGYVSPPLPCLYAKKLGQQKKTGKKLFPFSVYKYVQG